MIFVIKIVKLVIWGILHHRVRGDVYVELGVVFIWFWLSYNRHKSVRSFLNTVI